MSATKEQLRRQRLTNADAEEVVRLSRAVNGGWEVEAELFVAEARLASRGSELAIYRALLAHGMAEKDASATAHRLARLRNPMASVPRWEG